MLGDFLPVDLPFQSKPEDMIEQAEIDLPKASKLVLRILEYFELQAEETVNSVFAIFNTVAFSY